MCDVHTKRDKGKKLMCAREAYKHYNTHEVMLHNKVNISLRDTYGTLLSPPNKPHSYTIQ